MCFSLDGCVCLVIQLCPTLCNPMGCSPPGSSVHGDSPGKNTGVGCHALLQGIFPNQGWNPGLLHCRWILYCLSHQGSPRTLEWLSYPSPGDLPDSGIEPGSPALQADSLPAELPGKPLDGRHSKLSSDALSSHTVPSLTWGPCSCYFPLHSTWLTAFSFDVTSSRKLTVADVCAFLHVLYNHFCLNIFVT